MPASAPPNTAPARRIGVFGGTFDPPHVGHVLTGQRVAEARSLDLVLFVVANDPWQKSGDRVVTPAAIRLRMVEQACFWSRSASIDLEASDIEIRAGGPSYSADTLRTLRAAEPTATFELIVGSDAASQIHTWHEADWLADNAHFVVVGRGGQPGEVPAGFTAESVDCPLLEISSTDIRERVRDGRSIDHLTTASVRGLISGYGLYRDNSP